MMTAETSTEWRDSEWTCSWWFRASLNITACTQITCCDLGVRRRQEERTCIGSSVLLCERSYVKWSQFFYIHLNLGCDQTVSWCPRGIFEVLYIHQAGKSPPLPESGHNCGTFLRNESKSSSVTYVAGGLRGHPAFRISPGLGPLPSCDYGVVLPYSLRPWLQMSNTQSWGPTPLGLWGEPCHCMES